MTLMIDDTKKITRLVITNGSKTLLRKKGKDIKTLLRFVYDGTKNDNLRDSIGELQHSFMFMVGSKTTIDLKDK